MNDPMVQFFLSGQAHTYYGLLGIIASLLIVAAGGSLGWLLLAAAFAGGIFVDEWVHGYLH